MNNFNIEHKNSICYSGYRVGQKPGFKYPSYEEVKEDLLILQENWSYLRIYDCTKHADLVLEVIKKEKLNIKVMLGSDLSAEVENPNCPWGANYTDDELKNNRENNLNQVKRSIELSKTYPDIVNAISVGNEATVDWGDHLVPVESVIQYARLVKKETNQPVTFCENYVPWSTKLEALVDELDFISLHTYPVWEMKSIHEALDFTKENYYGVVNKYPGKKVVITEAGWATNSNGRGIQPENVNQDLQKEYCKQLVNWSNENEILIYLFEAFDEPWKGSDDQLEPEKHWGLFKVDRTPKLVMKKLFSDLAV